MPLTRAVQQRIHRAVSPGGERQRDRTVGRLSSCVCIKGKADAHLHTPITMVYIILHKPLCTLSIFSQTFPQGV